MNIEYEEMVVTFIDILGFKKLIKSENITEVRKVIEHFNGFKNLSMYCHKTGNPNNDTFNSISASDAIIRLTRFPEDCNKELVTIKEIKVLASIQLKLICYHQILIRGGLSIGKMYFNYNDRLTSFFGPAYIRAYEIESKIASYPRIVIDKSVDYDKLVNGNNRHISYGKDGELFVDYLENSRYDEGVNGFTYELINKHKNSILKLIKNIDSSSTSIKNKYVWLALYHNEHCLKYNYPADWMIDQMIIDELNP